MSDSVLIVAKKKSLLDWYRLVKRNLPWRQTRDPYLIWLSEVMLQQTRVEQALPYYDRFIVRFPDVETLAGSDLDEVLRHWEGLGYYARARNLHKGAQQIVDRYNGRFPETYETVIEISGIGPYTAAAVMSIAFNKPYAVVDGNVTRVICRLFAIGGDIRTRAVQKQVEHKAGELLDRVRPGEFNQAMMELGATVCTPASPDCPSCPFQQTCRACQENNILLYPYKSPAKKRPHYQIAAGVVRDKSGRVLVIRRPENAMLGGLWEFPGGKQETGELLQDTVRRELHEELDVDVAVDQEPFEVIQHAYSHFSITLHAFFATIKEDSGPPVAQNSEPLQWVDVNRLGGYAFPKANRRIIDTLLRCLQKQDCAT